MTLLFVHPEEAAQFSELVIANLDVMEQIVKLLIQLIQVHLLDSPFSHL
jgi:hypothetical protein